jgi:hypothetical protein
MTEDTQAQNDKRFKENEAEEARTPDVPEPEWKPSREVFQVLFCLSIISLMASLDMTIFLPILPVSAFIRTYLNSSVPSNLTLKIDYSRGAERRRHQYFLDR